MLKKLAQLFKGNIANLALIGIFISVKSLMSYKGLFLGELHQAIFTLIGFFSSMNRHMYY